MKLRALLLLVVFATVRSFAAETPANEADYNQWKQALRAPATPATNLSAAPGFTVELLRAARPDEGSWVSLAFDPRGRLVIAREDRGLLRLTFPPNGVGDFIVETVNTNLAECRGLLFAFDALYANANNSKALYRLRDTDGDDQFDDVKLLRATGGGVGHGRNDLVLGSDNFIYLIHGDDVRLPGEGAAPASPFRALAPTGLLPCAWDNHLYGGPPAPPGGHVIRTDRDGREWEVFAGGLRNPYGLDFNPDGELFTFDADLEWDVGLPWYHPTRVLHVTPGADYGWRRSVDNLPEWLPDSLPAAVDIGKGSPTAVRFGTRSRFPPRYRRALFILDWAYGSILAVHLTPRGASYDGRFETFLKGRPLNVTDIDFGPDGALYFITGGRRTQSGLYRVRHTGPAVREFARSRIELAADRAAAEARALRRHLEAWQRTEDTNAIAQVWPHLDSDDPWIRHAARTALERQPVAAWSGRALSERKPGLALAGLLALARSGAAEFKEPALTKLASLPLKKMSAEGKLIAARAAAVALLRWGKPEEATARALVSHFNSTYPDRDPRVNQQLCELLVFLEAPDVPAKTLPLLASAATQEEKLRYLFLLRLAKQGWTLTARRNYFTALASAREFTGAHYLPLVLKYIRADAEATLTETERAELKDVLARLDQPLPRAAVAFAPPDSSRRLVKEWRTEDFTDALAAVSPRRDLAKGKALFTATGCAQCHQFAGEGSAVGPELTGVAGRFSSRDLLESILEPSKVIAESYRTVTVTTKSGLILDGRLLAEDDQSLTLAPNPIDADSRRRLRKSEITSQTVSTVSSMPSGLLDSLTREEVLDLLSYLQHGGR